MRFIFKTILVIFTSLFFVVPFAVEAGVLSRPANNLGLVGYWKLGVDGRQGASEMNTNWDMEAGVTTNWAFDAKSTGVRANETTDVFRGNISAKLTNSTSSSIAFWQDGMSTVDGELYLVSVWAKDIDSPTTPYFSNTFAARREDGTTNGGSFSSITTDRWTHFWSVWEATSTTIDPYIRTGSHATQGSFLIDDFSVQKLMAMDFSGNGNHGTLMNSVALASGFRNDANGAFEFSGSDEWIDVNSKPVPASGDFSISGWFYLESDSSRGGVFQRKGSSPYNGVGLGKGASNVINFGLFDTSGNLLSAQTSQSLNTWVHYIGVYDVSEKTVNLYENGVLVDSVDNPSFTGNLDISSQLNLRIGRRDNSTTDNWDGRIDEVRIYNRALSASEARGLYQSGLVTVGGSRELSEIEGLIHWYTFDGSNVSPTTVIDSVGGNDGVIENGPFVALGRVGQGMQFNSGTQQVDLDSSIELGNTDWTMSTWVKTSSSEMQNLLSNQSGGPVTNAFRIFSGGNPGYYHYNGSWQSKIGGSDIDDGEWHFIAWVNDGDTNTISTYVDGVLDLDGVDSTVTNNGPVNRIGRYWASSGGGLMGVMDDLRVYNRSLTESEVKRIYNATRPSSVNLSKVDRVSSGLIAHWTFDGPNIDLSATTAEVRDISGNVNHGDAQNGASPGIGKSGQGYLFDGSGIVTATVDELTFSNTVNFTASVWFKVTGTPDSGNVMGILGRRSVDRWGIDYYFEGEKLRFGTRDADGGTYSVQSDFGPSLHNEWHHAVLIHEANGNISAYLNGEAVGSTADGSWSVDSVVTIASSNSCIGGDCSNLIGATDDVRIYSRVLSEEEIKQLYNMGN